MNPFGIQACPGIQGRRMKRLAQGLLSLTTATVLSACSSPSSEDACCPPHDCPHPFSKIAEIPGWYVSAKPMNIVGPISFVGTKKLGVWLIQTSESPEEYLLMNTGAHFSAGKILRSLETLKVDPKHIKILLACHPHVDHVGALARMQEITGAKIWMIEEAKKVFESGGRNDFAYGKLCVARYRAATVDRVLVPGRDVCVGDIALRVLHTPGHSRGCTTFVMDVVDHGRSHHVVFPDGTGVNPNYKLVDNSLYPEITKDYRSTFKTLKGLRPDIWLAPHLASFDFDRKRARAEAEMDCRKKAAAWVDPEGFAKWVCCEKASFEKKLWKQTKKHALARHAE